MQNEQDLHKIMAVASSDLEAMREDVVEKRADSTDSSRGKTAGFIGGDKIRQSMTTLNRKV